MNRINITDEVLALHEKEYLSKIDREVEEEYKDGLPEDVLSKARQLMVMADERLKPKSSKVVEVDFEHNKKVATEIHTDNVVSFEAFGEFELLAAASKDSDVKWYEQIITVGAIDGRGGCLLEINPYGEGSKEVKITLSAEPGSESVIKQMLNKFAGKDVDVEISLAGTSILSAEIYVTPEASLAEGMGVIQQFERPDTKNEKLKIGFVIKK
jgi:hypothetical protein